MSYFLSYCFTLIKVFRIGISQVSIDQLAMSWVAEKVAAYMIGIASKSCPARRVDKSSSDIVGI